MDSIEKGSGNATETTGETPGETTSWARLRPKRLTDYIEILLFVGAAGFLAYLLMS